MEMFERYTHTHTNKKSNFILEYMYQCCVIIIFYFSSPVVSIRSLTEDDLVSLLQLLSDRGEVEGEEKGVWLIARCLVLFQSRKLKEACTLADKDTKSHLTCSHMTLIHVGTALSLESCDNWFVSCVCHMRSHDYDITIYTARTGTYTYCHCLLSGCGFRTSNFGISACFYKTSRDTLVQVSGHMIVM